MRVTVSRDAVGLAWQAESLAGVGGVVDGGGGGGVVVVFLMIRRPPRSTLDRSSAASDVYKRQGLHLRIILLTVVLFHHTQPTVLHLQCPYPCLL